MGWAALEPVTNALKGRGFPRRNEGLLLFWRTVPR